MNQRTPLTQARFVGALLFALLPLGQAFAQPEAPSFSAASSRWDGLSEFSEVAIRRLGSERVKFAATLDYEGLTDHDAVILLHPENSLASDSLTRFLADGGRLALLDDFGKAESFLNRFGIERVSAPPNPKDRIMGDPDLAIAVPAIEVVAGVERGRHPITEGVDEVVTNHPTAFRHPRLTEVLEIPDSLGAPAAILVTGIISDRGRLVALSDPSIFINLMMRYPGNRKLAEGLLAYLGQDEEQKDGKVYILSGNFSEKGQYGEGSPLESMEQKWQALKETSRKAFASGLPAEMGALLGALILFIALKTEVGHQLRVPRRLLPRFARKNPVFAQTGLLARAETLSLKSTPPVLLVLEMQGGLEESLDQVIPGYLLMSQKDRELRLDESPLPPELKKNILGLIRELARRTRGFEHGRAPRTSQAELKRLHERLRDAQGLLQQKKRTGLS